MKPSSAAIARICDVLVGFLRRETELLNSEQIIAVGKAIRPYLRSDITDIELGTAAHDAAVALRKAMSP